MLKITGILQNEAKYVHFLYSYSYRVAWPVHQTRQMTCVLVETKNSRPEGSVVNSDFFLTDPDPILVISSLISVKWCRSYCTNIKFRAPKRKQQELFCAPLPSPDTTPLSVHVMNNLFKYYIFCWFWVEKMC